MEGSESLHAFVKGHVQGVYYRASTAFEAQRLGCTGFVRNLPDGGVEVMAEGRRQDLEALLRYLREGPAYAYVTGVAVTWDKAGGTFCGFDVIY
jgi:acylphosphatase